MKKLTATQHIFHCKVKLPASKSESNRLLIIQALTKKPFAIKNLSNADDTLMLDNLLKSNNAILNCGSGGTTFRFLLALQALKGEIKTLTCSPQLSQRPIKPLVDALLKMGANIKYADVAVHPPLNIGKGDFSLAKNIDIKANISSQFTSALLLIAPSLPNGLSINLKGKILSKPYIDLTLGLMNQFGVNHIFNGDKISIEPQEYLAKDTVVGADWSAASYFYALAVMASDAVFEFEGLDLNSMQGDKIVADLMLPFGIETEATSTGIKITKTMAHLPDSFEFDFTNCPDLAQTFAFLCAGLGIAAKLNGIENLIHKETDRLQAIKNEITKMGTAVMLTNSTLSLAANSQPKISNTIFQTYDDHRMAMAIAPLAAQYGSLFLSPINVVSKSFPDFWTELKKCGLIIK